MLRFSRSDEMWQVKHHRQYLCELISTSGKVSSCAQMILFLGAITCGKDLTNPMLGFVSQRRNVAGQAVDQ